MDPPSLRSAHRTCAWRSPSVWAGQTASLARRRDSTGLSPSVGPIPTRPRDLSGGATGLPSRPGRWQRTRGYTQPTKSASGLSSGIKTAQTHRTVRGAAVVVHQARGASPTTCVPKTCVSAVYLRTLIAPRHDFRHGPHRAITNVPKPIGRGTLGQVAEARQLACRLAPIQPSRPTAEMTGTHP